MDERTEQGRRFLMGYRDDDTTEFVSDQEKKLPQPPLCKAPMGGERTVLPRDFSALPEGGGLYDLLTRRRSARIYTEGELSLLQLSFLLWATQGVRAMRGRAYATLRTVPSGGARHAFETYLVVRYVEGLRPGAYHYLPMEHALEFLHPVEQLEDVVSDTLCGQSWAAKASVIFSTGPLCPIARSGVTAPMPMRRCSSMPGMWAKISILPARRRASAPAACAPSAMSCAASCSGWTARRSLSSMPPRSARSARRIPRRRRRSISSSRTRIYKACKKRITGCFFGSR